MILFFCKQKTAYEMRISDWSSDVCSSDLFDTVDGTGPRPIGGPVREWFFANLNASYRDRIMAVVDKPRDLIYWYYPSAASSGELDSVLIYNYRTDRWGKQARTITAALQYSSGQISYDDRSEERRVGNECVSKCRNRWGAYNK